MRSVLLILVACLLLSGCASVRYTSPSHQASASGQTIVTRYYRFAWGLVPGNPVSLDQCGSAGIQKMKVRSNFVDSLITGLTVGIVAPTRVKITCAQAAPAAQ